MKFGINSTSILFKMEQSLFSIRVFIPNFTAILMPLHPKYIISSLHSDLHYWFIAGVDSVDYSLYPNKEFQLKYLHMYLEETAILKGHCINSDVIITSCVML